MIYRSLRSLARMMAWVAALHPEFAAEVVDVPLDRVHTHDEAAGDFAVGSAFQQQAQHLALALCQRLGKRIGMRRCWREI